MSDQYKQSVLDEVQELSNRIKDLLIEEHQLQDRELLRMSGLLQEAVSELSGCFNVMTDQLVTQSSQLRSRDKTGNDSDLDRNISSLMLSTQQMNSCVTRAVVALQFEDILQQMINHSRQRIEETIKLLRFLFSSIEMLEDGHIKDASAIIDILQKCQAEVAKTSVALDLSNPAQQQSMKKGDITLF